MLAACEHIGGDCTPELLRAAKKAGCGAFRNGRIYVKELSDWLKNNEGKTANPSSKEALQIEKLKEEVARLRRENAIEDSRYVSIEEHKQINAKIDGEILTALDDVFSDGLIHDLGGQDFAGRRAMIDDALATVREKIHAPSRAEPS